MRVRSLRENGIPCNRLVPSSPAWRVKGWPGNRGSRIRMTARQASIAEAHLAVVLQ